MHFANWIYAPLIIATGCAALLVFLAYLFWKRHTINTLFPDAAARRRVISGTPVDRMAAAVMVALSIILSTFVLLRPQWGDKLREVPAEGTDVLVLMDVSSSMLVRDAGDSSRLDRAKEAVRLLSSSLEGDRIGLILFAGDAFLQCPLTADRGAFLMFLDGAGPDSVRIQGSDLGRAMETARRVFTEKRLTSKVMVLITDGEDNEGRAVAAAGDFSSMGVSIYTLGVGSEEGDLVPDPGGESGNMLRDSEGRTVVSRHNGTLLEEIAETTGGAYSDITRGFSGVSSLAAVIRGEDGRLAGTRRIHEKEDRYAFFVILLLLLLTAEISLPADHERIMRITRDYIKRISARLKGIRNAR